MISAMRGSTRHRTSHHGLRTWIASELCSASSWRRRTRRCRSAPIVPTSWPVRQWTTAVVIENRWKKRLQHLGQVLAYLAGLDARMVVWIARGFDDAHLSAIRWLNDHTVDPYAFFAVRVRVVRIGNSALAPVFEVLQRPSNWDRNVRNCDRWRSQRTRPVPPRFLGPRRHAVPQRSEARIRGKQCQTPREGVRLAHFAVRCSKRGGDVSRWNTWGIRGDCVVQN